MKTEIEIKLALSESTLRRVVDGIEKEFKKSKSLPFHQITHQFFLDDYTKQNVFPRIRNEENGSTTLTVKAKTKDNSNFFERIELETTIGDIENTVAMMSLLGFPKKITWEKKRINFTSKNGISTDISFSLDETPMGWFLEIEAPENEIEEAIIKLNLQTTKRASRAYLGLWEDYRREHGIVFEDMLFKNVVKR